MGATSTTFSAEVDCTVAVSAADGRNMGERIAIVVS